MLNNIQPIVYTKGGGKDGILYNLRNPNGNRYFLYLYRKTDGSWNWNYNWLDNDRNASNPSLGLANNFISSAFFMVLYEKLKLNLHPNKVHLSTIYSGIDFLGWILFPKYRALRTSTKRRMFRKLLRGSRKEVISSYLGLLKYGNTFKLRDEIVKKLAFNDASC